MRSPMTIPQYIEHVEYRIHYYRVHHELAEDKDFWMDMIKKDEEELERVHNICERYNVPCN